MEDKILKPSEQEKFDKVVKSLENERIYQIKKWGYDDNKNVGDFLTFMDVYLQEAKVYLTKQDSTALTMLSIRKLTALGIAAMEKFGAVER
jgi:hypothetical protein